MIDSSFRGTTPIFLHDPWCPLSARAFRQMERLGSELPTLDVAKHRLLSKEIERRTGVRHESPQVIVLRDAVAVWDASHGKVTAEAVRQALSGPMRSHPEQRPGTERDR
jgi:bacillithiol system protein YtxJ